MTKVRAGILATMLAFTCGLAASAHGGGHGGGGGGMHFSGGGHMSSFHSSSFHSSPSFHSSFSSFHSAPSFHSSFSSFHSSPSFHSSSPSFESSPSFNSSPGGFGSFGFGSHHSHVSTPDGNINSGSSMHSGTGLDSSFGHHHSHDMTSENGINNDTGASHHGGFLFWGHHNSGTQVTTIPGEATGLSAPVSDHHHGGFLFWGHHNNNTTPPFGDGSPTNVAYSHHHHPNFNSMNIYPVSVAPPPSTLIINMAQPPVAVPMHSLAITKYFYPQTNYYSYNTGYFGGYGSTYGGYAYFPTRGIASLLFRLMSLIGFGSRSNYGAGLSSNNYLGTWGPQSSLMTGAFDNANSTNFVDNYDNFNYTGGNVQPFANLLPDGTPYGDNDPQNLALQNPDGQNPDPQNQNQNQNTQNPDGQAQNLLSMNTPNQYLPPSLTGQVSDNRVADPENPVELKATAQALQPAVAFGPPTYDYHHVGVLGSAFTHNIKLPAGAYRAPELLGIIFTHEFWDVQNQAEDNMQQMPIVTGQN